MILAPWTEEQIESLNAFQNAQDAGHAYVCRREPKHPPLVATTSGWQCIECEYRQPWAHAWTADWSWKTR